MFSSLSPHQLLPSPLFLLFLATSVRGQQSDVNCPTAFDFLKNERGQDACTMVSCLWGQSKTPPQTFRLWDLNSNDLDGYPGPVSTNQSDWSSNRVECSMPFYNLIAACVLCQGKDVTAWSHWTGSCNETFTGEPNFPVLNLPIDVPSSTVLPPWVYIDSSAPSTGDGHWSEQVAQQNITAEASASSSASSTSSGATSTSNTPNDDDHSSSNTGAIVGGVVGGLALFAIIGVGGFWVYRRYLRKTDTYNGNGEFGLGGYSGGGSARLGSGGISHNTTPDMHQAGGAGYVVPPSHLGSGGDHPDGSAPRTSSFSGAGHSSPGYSNTSPRPGGPSAAYPEIQTDSDLSRPDEYPTFRP